MYLHLEGNTLRIRLTWWMNLLACRLSVFEIPLANIKRVSTEQPRTRWHELRMPGTFIPGLIKAGTYYREGRKEFWCVARGQPVLRLSLENEHFDSLTLSMPDNQHWATKLLKQLHA